MLRAARGASPKGFHGGEMWGFVSTKPEPLNPGATSFATFGLGNNRPGRRTGDRMRGLGDL